MSAINDPRSCVGATMYGPDEDKIGKIGHLYLDDTTGEPEWATVATGLFGRRETFVPLEDARQTDDGIVVPYSKDQIKDAPNIDPDDGHITPEEEQRLDEHYRRVAGSNGRSDDDLTDLDDQRGRDRMQDRDVNTGDDLTDPSVGQDRDRAVEGDPSAASAGGARQPRLRRWTETEYESVQVPVQREHVAIDDDDTTTH